MGYTSVRVEAVEVQAESKWESKKGTKKSCGKRQHHLKGWSGTYQVASLRYLGFSGDVSIDD